MPTTRFPAAVGPQRDHRPGRGAAGRVAPHRLLPDSRRASATVRTLGGSQRVLMASVDAHAWLQLNTSDVLPVSHVVLPGNLTWTLQPTDAIHTARQGVSRSTWQCAFSFVLAARSDAAPRPQSTRPPAAHASRRTSRRVSRLARPTPWIHRHGTPDRIERLAHRHGLTRQEGAEHRRGVDGVGSGAGGAGGGRRDRIGVRRRRVRSHRRSRPQTTGAEAAWAGAIAALGAATGRGIGVAIIDCGIAAHPALAEPRGRQRRLHRARRPRRRRLRARHARRRHHRRARLQRTPSRARIAAWRRPRT